MKRASLSRIISLFFIWFDGVVCKGFYAVCLLRYATEPNRAQVVFVLWSGLLIIIEAVVVSELCLWLQVLALLWLL